MKVTADNLTDTQIRSEFHSTDDQSHRRLTDEQIGKFMPSHEIAVFGGFSTLVIRVMLSDGHLWQRSEHERRAPSALWQYHHGVLTFWNGVMPSGVTVSAISARKAGGK